MIFWLLLGVVIGYLFKPQIDEGIKHVARLIKEAGSNDEKGGSKGSKSGGDTDA